MIAITQWLAYRGKFLPIGRVAFRKTLSRGRTQRSPEILLPPWVAVHELCFMLRTKLAMCMRACGVSISRGNYTWTDQEGRIFQSNNKRHVLVPFEAAVAACKKQGYQPIQVSPEPESPKRCVTKKALPVITIIGHKDHGKTSLMERLCAEEMLVHEYGNTTQQVVIRSVMLPTEDGHVQATVLDTPGDALFELSRGRALHLADLAILLLSVEGGEVQTRDLIVQANRFNVPVIFCINKADLEFREVEVARAELKRQCSNMYRAGLIATDMADQVRNAVALSTRTGIGLAKLGTVIAQKLENSELPINPTYIAKPFGGISLKEVESFIRRTNCLVSTGDPPFATCFIIEVEKTHSYGVVLTIIIRHGVLIEGAYFVAGTEYGRIAGIYPINGKIIPDAKMERAYVGQAVRITGLKSNQGTSADDILCTMSQHEAFRLSQYRKELQLLRSNQIQGPLIDLPWAVVLKPSEDAGYPDIKTATVDNDVINEVRHNDALIDDPLPSSILLKPIDSESKIVEQLSKDFTDGETTDCSDSETDLHLYPHERGDSNTNIHEINEAFEDPNENWNSVVAQRNKQLREKWAEKLDNMDMPEESLKAHGVAPPPKLPPEIGRPVVPVILRANFVGSFDALLDGFEQLELRYNVRIPVVHGGLGAVTPSDVVQADIGNKFGCCPIYAFQVPVLIDAAKHAVINHVVVKQLNVYSDLLSDVEKRCERAISHAKRSKNVV
ncbi:Elongation factor Tu GTP binding domain family protein [Babesia bovis T2Bo]|uniref:Small GTP-binding and elongation factor Tu GTP binding domain containing protein n=1 Tax=Babesia bovis TaxID=5865 RepID=A7AWQ0_BABBO|nr:Elongation factor Tu GTP binding domain family protein [Babesia bovis T2Bo]EDO05478.1 Elongation factor Tu GTP binding domain family protein [Babesia bovis T2Bo]|eukprot:XP_001609046.1 small GTP-binding and elongation factor Tu GTP binding domain containing protein [Babesia bovis T2Bo]